MSAWNDITAKDPWYYRAWNILKAPFAFLFYLTFAVLTTPVNTIKAITEFLPSLFANLGKEGAVRAKNAAKKFKMETKLDSTSKNIFNQAVYYVYRGLYHLAGFFSLLCELAFFVGKAITSPAEGILSAWQTGHKYFGTQVWIDGRKSYEFTVAGCIAGGLFALLSFAITTITYTLLFPLLASTMTGTWIANLAHVFEPASNAIYHFLNPLFTAFSIPIASNVAVTGFAALAGMCAACVLPAAGICEEYIHDWFNPVEMQNENTHSVSNDSNQAAKELNENIHSAANDLNQAAKKLPKIIKKSGKAIDWLSKQNKNKLFSSSQTQSGDENNQGRLFGYTKS